MTSIKKRPVPSGVKIDRGTKAKTKLTRFGQTGNPVPIMRTTLRKAKNEGRRLFEDMSLGEPGSAAKRGHGVVSTRVVSRPGGRGSFSPPAATAKSTTPPRTLPRPKPTQPRVGGSRGGGVKPPAGSAPTPSRTTSRPKPPTGSSPSRPRGK